MFKAVSRSISSDTFCCRFRTRSRDRIPVLKHQVDLHINPVRMVLNPETGYSADSLDAADNKFDDLIYRVVGYGITAQIAECRPYDRLLLVRLETQLPLAAEYSKGIEKIS